MTSRERVESTPGRRSEGTPGRRSDATRAAILRAARERFAADGYERATIRAIAADADIDPSMVMRYYGSKEKLFAAAAEFDLRLPELAELPPDRIGAALVGHFVDRWDGDETMTALLRAGTTNPAAAERMRQIFASQLAPVVRRALGSGAEAEAEAEAEADRPEAEGAWLSRLSPEQRAGLVASQILGLALTRYVLILPPVADLTRDDLVAWIGPTIHRYLTAPSPSLRPSPSP
ncbi:TetR family transcriptional regulator [Solwaraspora sp. WMMD1047]|uniref:TetR/AcrR family transcriptional regulator n=1 Tax=Solwaraspora sp. WMMD1047 TaxID=3016102 RepID=UPI00241790EC|nr:TetR family transcriptional regulator [Solwaraspora sp. WMMD1047]MDG4834680.1 TetR family transcriptional regulator [Solwaraspora sp. WMMD1047]